jgi:hypothetical protein
MNKKKRHVSVSLDADAYHLLECLHAAYKAAGMSSVSKSSIIRELYSAFAATADVMPGRRRIVELTDEKYYKGV